MYKFLAQGGAAISHSLHKHFTEDVKTNKVIENYFSPEHHSQSIKIKAISYLNLKEISSNYLRHSLWTILTVICKKGNLSLYQNFSNEKTCILRICVPTYSHTQFQYSRYTRINNNSNNIHLAYYIYLCCALFENINASTSISGRGD